MVNCHFHKDMVGIAVCSHCSKDICEDCLIYIDGEPICKYCAKDIASSQAKHETYVLNDKRNMSWMLLLSFFPGINYIYLGLVKRGLLFIAAFLMATYITIETWSIVSLAAMFIIFATSFIDGFIKKGKMLLGVEVNDGIEDIKAFLVRRKALIVPLIIFSIIITIIQHMIFALVRGVLGLLGFLLESLFGVIVLLFHVFRLLLQFLGNILNVFTVINISSLILIGVGCILLIKYSKK